MNDQFIGSYRILRKVGAGGMASVYLAVHQDVPNLKVVLKVLSDQRLVDRFRQEADKLALLDGHPHVCQLKHFFNHGDDMVIAMEFIDGATLDEIIKRDGRLPEQQTLAIIIDVLSTLEFAHQKKIFHRDIKPSNIMLDAKGQVKIIDFGIAKGESDPSLTIAGSSTGTPAYMAPEQFNPSDQINYALADIYAVGTTLFYMLTGSLPFSGDNPFALRDAKLFTEPVKPRDLNPDISKNLEQIILKSINKDPEARYASVGEMRSALLGQHKAEVTQPIGGQTAGTSARKSGHPRKSGSKVVPVIGILALICVAALAYFLFFKGEKETAIAPPDLKSPALGTSLSTPRPNFEWTATAPKDGSYILEVAENQSFTDSKRYPELTDSQFAVRDSLPEGSWFWRVQAVDKNGKSGPFSALGSFAIAFSHQAALSPGTLALVIQPAGDLFIDGKPYGKNQPAATVALDPGRHVIRAENRESVQKTITDTVEIAGGSRVNHTIAFQMPAARKTPAVPPASQSAYGEVRVASKPTIGATVYIDGKLQEKVTPFTFRLTAGEHLLKGVLTIDGVEKTLTETVRISPDSVEKVIFDFEK